MISLRTGVRPAAIAVGYRFRRQETAQATAGITIAPSRSTGSP